MAEPRFPDGPPLNGCGCCHRAFALAAQVRCSSRRCSRLRLEPGARGRPSLPRRRGGARLAPGSALTLDDAEACCAGSRLRSEDGPCVATGARGGLRAEGQGCLMGERPPLRRGLDRSSLSAAFAPTAAEVARFSQRSAHVGRDRGPGQVLERVPQPGRLPQSRPVAPPPAPEPEPELSPGEEQRIRDAASGRVSLRAVRSTHKARLGL
jgi:hypothetical protein